MKRQVRQHTVDSTEKSRLGKCGSGNGNTVETARNSKENRSTE